MRPSAAVSESQNRPLVSEWSTGKSIAYPEVEQALSRLQSRLVDRVNRPTSDSLIEIDSQPDFPPEIGFGR